MALFAWYLAGVIDS